MRPDAPDTPEAPDTEAPAAASISVRLRSLQLDGSERRRPRRLRWWKLFALLLILAALGGAGSFGYVNYYVPSTFPEVDVVVFTRKISQETLLDLSGYVAPRVKVHVGADVGGTIMKVLFQEGQRVNKGDLLIQIDDERYRAECDQAVADLGSAEVQLLELKNGSRKEEIEQAQAMVDLDESRLNLAKKDFQRASTMDRGAMSKSDLDRFRSALLEAEASLRSRKANLRLTELGPREERIRAAQYAVGRAQANVARAKWFIDRARITAPIAGTILEKKTEVGETVHPEVVSPALLVMGDLSRFDAEVGVQERDLSLLGKVDRCEIIPDAYTDRVYAGRVDRLQPMVSRQRGVVQVKVAITAPDDHLLPEMACRVLFIKDPPKDADQQLPLIPLKAVVDEEEDRGPADQSPPPPQRTTPTARVGSQQETKPSTPASERVPPAGKAKATVKVVYVLEDQLARRRVIEVGRTRGDSVEIVQGLREGDLVLIPGAQPLSDGQTVRPKVPSRDERATRKDR